MSMYGTRDAASIWGDTWSDVLKESSMKVGTACPGFFCSRDGDLKGSCHGDDFCVVARQKQLQTFGKVLEKRFEVKQTGHIGFGVNDEKELKSLNRTVKIDVLNDEMMLEADTKLVENALESMKLNGAKGVDSPRVGSRPRCSAPLGWRVRFRRPRTLHALLVLLLPQLPKPLSPL